MTCIIGLDPSLTHSAGFHGSYPHGADLGESAPIFRPFAIKSSPKEHAHPLLRLIAIREAFVRELESARAADDASPRGESDGIHTGDVVPPLLVIEGYSMGSAYGREALGELGGTLRLAAFECGWRVLVVSPSTLKSYVTDKGNAKKEQMMLGAYKRWGYSAAGNDECDAYGLARMGLDWTAREAGAELPKRVTTLLDKLAVWGPAVASTVLPTAKPRRRSTRATAALSIG